MECFLKVSITFLFCVWLLCVHVSSGFPLHSQNFNARGVRDCNETQYYDGVTRTCKECATICKAGFELDSECGWGDGSDGLCQKCLPGTFQSGNTYYCNACSFCKNRKTIKECTLTQDTQCGDCLPGFTYNNQVGMCVKCSTNCPRAKTKSSDVPPTTATTTLLPVPISTSKTIITSVKGPKREPSLGPSETHTGSSTGFVAVIVILFSLLALLIVVMLKKRIRRFLKGTVCEKLCCHDASHQEQDKSEDVSTELRQLEPSDTTESLLTGGHSSNASLQNLSGSHPSPNPAGQDVTINDDDRRRHASEILFISSKLEQKDFELLKVFSIHIIDNFSSRIKDESKSFSCLVKTLGELEKYSMTKPCILVEGLSIVGREDLATRLYKVTFCPQHKERCGSAK